MVRRPAEIIRRLRSRWQVVFRFSSGRLEVIISPRLTCSVSWVDQENRASGNVPLVNVNESRQSGVFSNHWGTQNERKDVMAKSTLGVLLSLLGCVTAFSQQPARNQAGQAAAAAARNPTGTLRQIIPGP